MSLCLVRDDEADRLRRVLAAFVFICLLSTLGLSLEKVTVSHVLGDVRVGVNPARIVAFDLSVLDSIDRLGAQGLSFAVPKQNMPPYLAKYATGDAVDAGGMKEPNLERIYEFRPDVIFISARQTDYYEKLSRIAPTICANVDYGDFLASFRKNMAMLGELFPGRGDASGMADEVIARAATVAEKARNGKKNALVVMVNDGNISVYGPGSRFGLIHDVLGVASADPAIRVSTHGQSVDFEYLAKIDPDILFVINRNMAIGTNGGESRVLDNELVKGTKAGRTEKIVNLDSSVWYLSGAGLESLEMMLDEVDAALD